MWGELGQGTARLMALGWEDPFNDLEGQKEAM